MSNNLENQLWKIANDLRGQMDSSEFKNYMLGFIFYRFLSENTEKYANNILENESYTTKYNELLKTDDIYEDLLLELKEQLGYHIEPEYLFSNFITKINKDETIVEHLSIALKAIERSSEGGEGENDFIGLFDDLDLNNNKLGSNLVEKNSTITKILLNIHDIDDLTTNKDTLGNAYEYLIKMFASDSGKKGGEFYTPTEVSETLARLVTVNKRTAKKVYDPTCGSGSLLLRAARNLDRYDYIYGQELNVTTFNLARMNMFLHGINFREFEIRQGNTLTNDRFEDHAGEEGMDIIVANPPFGTKWDPSPQLLDNDERFSKYGKLAPKSKGEFAFLQHMIHHLKENGVMASVVPHGVLFRGAAELTIRKYMIEKDNVIDAVIGLPANLFYGTGIPACIIVFKKCRETEDILFIDASNEFEKVKTQNILTEENINKIVETYKERKDIEKYSRKVSLKEVEENEYNLNIPRYVDTFEEEEPIDIEQVNKNIAELEQKIEQSKNDIEKYLKELGL